jgi:hypothetical protein
MRYGGCYSRSLGGALTVGLVVALVLMAQARETQAQVLYGSLLGNVRDQTGAAIPGADVEVHNIETGLTRNAVSNEVGNYNFPTLRAGTYTVRVAMPGFREYVQENIALRVNSIVRVDATLALGELTESLTVTAASTQLQTDRAEVRSEIPVEVIQNVPVPIGRNFQHLMTLLPGVTPARNSHSVPTNPSRALQFEVQGVSGSSNDFRIDGASNYDVWLPHITAYVPALESIETINVVTSSFDAEQGLAGGSAINVQIKSGSNELRGSAFWYHANNKTITEPFFMPAGERNPKYINNQAGGTVGGPIQRDRLFFFASWESTLLRQFASGLRTLPMMTMRAGDMSASDRPVYDPFTGNPDGSGREAFPGNIIPRDRMSPIALKIQGLLPALTFPDSETNNYYAAGAYSFDRHTIDTKVDWVASPQFNMYGRFSMLDYSQSAPTALGDTLGGGELAGGNPGESGGKTYSATIAGNYVFSPTVILDVNFGYSRKDTDSVQRRLDEKLGLDFLGIPGTNGPRFFEGGWPRFQVSGFETMGHTNGFMPYFRKDPQRQIAGNLNWTRGAHNIRFGGEAYAQQMNHTQPEFYGAAHTAQGGFTFGGATTTVLGGPGANRYNQWASFLLDAPTGLGKILQVPDEYSTRARLYSLYIRDQWAVTPQLTMSIGTRWEYFPMVTRADRGVERYHLETNKMWVCGVGSVPEDCGTEMSKRLFAPRFGLAYRVSDDFVVRAGYGLTNDPFSPARPLRTNHPMLVAMNITGPHARAVAGSMAEGIPAIPTPDLGDGIIDMPLNVAANFVGDKYERGYVQSWNLTLQRMLPWGFSGEVGYVATRQVRQVGFLDLNAGHVPGAGRAGQPLFERYGRTTLTRIYTPIAHSKYDALMMVLSRRFADGFSVDANYTFSKALGMAGVNASDSAPAIKAPEFYHLNYGLSGLHMPHKLIVSTIAELPFGRGKPWVTDGIGSAVLGGWQVNATLMAYSGSPFTVSASGAALNMPENSQRADQVKPEIQTFRPDNSAVQAREQVSWFDPFAFAPVDEARFGTASFNKLLGPSQFNVDFGVFRKFLIREGVDLQARVEVFNLTNTPHFSNPGANRSSMSLNPDGTIRSLGGYTMVQGIRNLGREGIDQRTLRFGLRLGF